MPHLAPERDRDVHQRVRYLRTADGVKLAWAEAGEGPTVLKAGNWLTHLEFDWQSPVWRHWVQFFASRARFIRHDERGCGMTDWDVPELSLARWVADLEDVANAASPAKPFALVGISQGAAIAVAYAARHPDRVTALVLYGGYAQGWARRGDPETIREREATLELARLGWKRPNSAFREVFTSRFIPGASRAQLDWFNDLCQKTTSASVAAEIMRARSVVDVTSELGEVRAPTLVFHGRDDELVPLAAGRLLASGLRDAEFVELDSRNHILLENEPAWQRFTGAVTEFLGLDPSALAPEDPVFSRLTSREREILSLLTEGLSNAKIAARLSLSDKTVRNHVSNVLAKLGVWSRTEAVVLARDRGFVRAHATRT